MHLDLSPEQKTIIEGLKVSLADFGKARSKLIPILQMIQKKLAYLSPAAIEMVAGHLDIPAAEVFGVATFYNQFRFNPPG